MLDLADLATAAERARLTAAGWSETQQLALARWRQAYEAGRATSSPRAGSRLLFARYLAATGRLSEV